MMHSHLSYPSWYVKLARVLILVVMDDALAQDCEEWDELDNLVS